MGFADTVVQKQVARIQETFIGATDTVQYAITGFGRHPIVLAGGLLGAFFGKPRYLVITDKAAYLLAAKKSTKLGPEHVIGTYPRALDLSSCSGLYPKVRFDDGEVVYVAKPYDKPLRELFASGS